MKLVALVLAAGTGTRFGSRGHGGKLSASLDGQPLITHALRAACAAPVERVVVVASPDLPVPERAGVEVVRLTSTALSDSLRAGVAAVGQVDGVFVFLGDMPRVPPDVAGRLAQALGQNYAAVPVYRSQRGHPVLLSARAMADLTGITGDRGAGALIKACSDVAVVEVGDAGVLLDIDRPEDLAKA